MQQMLRLLLDLELHYIRYLNWCLFLTGKKHLSNVREKFSAFTIYALYPSLTIIMELHANYRFFMTLSLTLLRTNFTEKIWTKRVSMSWHCSSLLSLSLLRRHSIANAPLWSFYVKWKTFVDASSLPFLSTKDWIEVAHKHRFWKVTTAGYKRNLWDMRLQKPAFQI